MYLLVNEPEFEPKTYTIAHTTDHYANLHFSRMFYFLFCIFLKKLKNSLRFYFSLWWYKIWTLCLTIWLYFKVQRNSFNKSQETKKSFRQLWWMVSGYLTWHSPYALTIFHRGIPRQSTFILCNSTTWWQVCGTLKEWVKMSIFCLWQLASLVFLGTIDPQGTEEMGDLNYTFCISLSNKSMELGGNLLVQCLPTVVLYVNRYNCSQA